MTPPRQSADQTRTRPNQAGAGEAPGPLRNPADACPDALRNAPTDEAHATVVAPRERACEDCGAPFTCDPVGRPRRFCSAACRQRAYRRRTGRPGLMAADPYWSDPHAALYVGHAARILQLLPAASVQTVVTSPPYYALRDYDGHPGQLGQEATPAGSNPAGLHPLNKWLEWLYQHG